MDEFTKYELVIITVGVVRCLVLSHSPIIYLK